MNENQPRIHLRPTGVARAVPGSRSSRVLILTAGYGEGHNAAARAIGQAVDAIDGPGTARVVDLFAVASPRINSAARRTYLHLINRWPKVWSWIYRQIDRARTPEGWTWLFASERRGLRAMLDREPSGVICCTYPIYAFLLNELARRGGRVPPVYNVVTDSISIHSLWWRAHCTGWFLPNPDSAAVLVRAGIPADQVHVSGFPVPGYFGANRLTLIPPDLALGATPRVLHIINSGTRNAEDTTGRLLRETPWDITCAVGRDTRLKARLERIAAGRTAPTRILGWTDQIPFLLMTRHAVVSKAGGATTQEAIAALCPMVVTQVVPGQEEGNFELLRRGQAGTLARSPEAVLASLQALFANGGDGWRRARTAMRAMARPDAAMEIAAALLEIAHAPVGATIRAAHDRMNPRPDG